MNTPIKAFSPLAYQQLTLSPFHNLGRLLNITPPIGGTCFEQAISLKKVLLKKGYKAYLHEAEVCLLQKKCHCLVRVEYHQHYFFIDIGSGWPTCFTSYKGVSNKVYNVCGVQFAVKATENFILIQRYNGDKWLDMNKIPLLPQNEDNIYQKFNHHFQDIKLPYDNELRFCWIADQAFYRITGQFLTIYKKTGVTKQKMTNTQLISTIKMVFPLLVKPLEQYFNNTN